MPPLPLEIPPGLVRTNSPNAAKGRFTDGDKVRFINGFAEKWSGWSRLSVGPMVGKARGAMAWANIYGNTNVAFGTTLKLYSLTGDDTLTDRTPIRSTGTYANNPIATTASSAVVTITHTAHGADDGDYVTIAGATAVGGITISGEYRLTKIDANSYTVTHSATASSTATGGGAAVTYAYQINTGTEESVVGLGWGAGTWGSGTWGTPRTSGIIIELRSWSLREYANDLLASPSLKSLYLWEEATDARAELVSGAPSSIRAMFVTGERFIMALGTTTPMTVQWPDVDDPTDWTASISNTANERTLQSGSKLMAGCSLADSVSMVWSDTSAYVFQYTGSDFIYDSRLVGTNCGLIAPLAFTNAVGVAFWIGPQNFYMYSGSVQIIPHSDDVKDFIFADMNPDNIAKTWCIYDQKYNQVRWGYCSLGADEPDKYVDVDLAAYTWTTGTLDRTTGCLHRPSDASMLMVDSSGYIYSHGVGLDANGSAMESYVTYGLYALANGENTVDVMGVIPDCKRQTGTLDFEIYTRERPNSTTNFDEATVSIAETDVIGDTRVSGRHFGLTVRSNEVGGDYRLGIVSLETQSAGARR